MTKSTLMSFFVQLHSQQQQQQQQQLQILIFQQIFPIDQFWGQNWPHNVTHSKPWSQIVKFKAVVAVVVVAVAVVAVAVVVVVVAVAVVVSAAVVSKSFCALSNSRG